PRARPRPCAFPAERPKSLMAPMPKPRSSSEAITSSKPRISTPPCPGRPVARPPVTARWKFVRSGRCRKRGAMAQGSDERAHETAEAVARQSYGKLVAFLAARTGDVAGAEDALSEAFASALSEWPEGGVP